MSDTKLLPCPFCGGEAANRDVRFAGDGYKIQCTKCGCSTISSGNTSEIVKVWNTRRPMERIVEQLNKEAVYEDCPVYEGDRESDNYIRVSNAIEIVQKGGSE